MHASVTIGRDGKPIISYYDSFNTALKVAHCTNPECTASQIVTVDSNGNVEQSSSITLVGHGGFPVIA